MQDAMPHDPIQGHGRECLKATQEESTVSPARDNFFQINLLLVVLANMFFLDFHSIYSIHAIKGNTVSCSKQTLF